MFLIRRIDYTKIKAQMANFITLINLSFGAVAIITLLKGFVHMSILFIFLAALFDRFDGMVARKYNIESDFGKELDSLCDMVSFGVAPAMLIYQTSLDSIPGVGLSLVIIFILCGAVRLARYNVKEFDGAFYGIPITAAGVILTFCALFAEHLPILFYAILTTILAILMVSNIRIQKM
ncbi:CDP-diacylglycerol--serine O-phosphatidyltransferase [Virgibacillus soli]|uniref:CDP-diacylglycerol--serine O-phosphatidyltransferase n=1 Tax=Paracerasibacillus soli TaxID=480284 RepID=A0ABU5CVB7_9BACI|nr:CDP-diacylglycerol--serine O-phosphatidyltransferase [Virgibacillus soli]MDY0410325.1 CDP-diacylglycerol--serine O-phosphatidyltransferase [Virgibacillus soli]